MKNIFKAFLFSIVCSINAENDLYLKKVQHSHTPQTGVTVISWTQPTEQLKRYVNIYRYKEPINQQNRVFADMIGGRIPISQGELKFNVKDSGKFYYCITVSTSMGRELDGEYRLGPFKEVDVTPPLPVLIKKGSTAKGTILSWQSPVIANPERISGYTVYGSSKPFQCTNDTVKLATVVMDYKNSIQQWHILNSNKYKQRFFAVTAHDNSGNNSVISNVISTGNMPDLAISSKSNPAENPDVEISKLYPKIGDEVKITLIIHNLGPVNVANADVSVKTDKGNIIHKQQFSIDAGSHHKVHFRYQPIKQGVQDLKIDLTCQDSINELTLKNNTLDLAIFSPEKDLYIHWYGDETDMVNANLAQCLKMNIDTWKERGGIACKCVGAVGNDLRKQYLQAAADGFDGITVDEICGDKTKKGTANLLKVLPELKHKHPDFFVAVWHIGSDIKPSVVQMLNENLIDLLMLEIYIKPGESLEPLKAALDNVKKLNLTDKVIIGLVTDKSWSNWATSKDYIAHLKQQMIFIKANLPTTPGIAFWSTNTLPGMRTAVDQLCADIFLKTNNKKGLK